MVGARDRRVLGAGRGCISISPVKRTFFWGDMVAVEVGGWGGDGGGLSGWCSMPRIGIKRFDCRVKWVSLL